VLELPRVYQEDHRAGLVVLLLRLLGVGHVQGHLMDIGVAQLSIVERSHYFYTPWLFGPRRLVLAFLQE